MSTAVMTDRELHQQLKAESTSYRLYNPSTVWLDARYGAQPFRLCPDGEAIDIATGAVRTTDGVTAIRDYYGPEWQEDEKGVKTKTGNETLIFTGIAIVKHILKGYPFVVLLSGTEKRDEAIKAGAKKKWVSHRHSWATQIKAGREAYLREFHASPSNSGQVPDPPSLIEEEAYEFLAEYHTGMIGRKAFVCRHDGYQTDDQKKWDMHQGAFHKAEQEKADADGGKGSKKK